MGERKGIENLPLGHLAEGDTRSGDVLEFAVHLVREKKERREWVSG